MTTPYYDEAGIVIYLGDCREVKVRPWSGVPITITDPPYGETSLGWDAWPNGWLDHTKGDVLWSFGSMRMLLEHGTEFVAAGYRFAQDVVWEKHNGSGFHADRFKRVHEFATHWYRGAWESHYRSVPTTPDGLVNTIRKARSPAHTGVINPQVAHYNGTRLTRSVIRVPSCHGEAQHPTQKPLGIIRPLIQYSVPTGGWVFDPFAGSGSVLVTAKEAGHRAIGVEVSERYCEVAARRLQQEVLAL